MPGYRVDMDHTATSGATVFEDGGIWQLSLESSTTDVVETVETGWDGTGSFEQEGLNFVGPMLRARGLRYRSWSELDSRYVAVLHRAASWGPR